MSMQVVPQFEISVVGDLVIKHYERCVENKNEKVAEPRFIKIKCTSGEQLVDFSGGSN